MFFRSGDGSTVGLPIRDDIPDESYRECPSTPIFSTTGTPTFLIIDADRQLDCSRRREIIWSFDEKSSTRKATGWMHPYSMSF